MATNFIRDGKKMVMATVTGAESGDTFVVGGYLPCVLLDDANSASPYNATVQTEGVFDISCKAHDGSSNSAIAVGDMLYWTDKDTALDKDSSEDPFGIALEAVSAGETATINVMLVPKAVMPGTVGTSDLEAAAVETAKIKDSNVTIEKLEDDVQDKVVTLDVTAVDVEDGTATVTIQAQDMEGNDLAENVLIRVWTAETSMGAVHAVTDITAAASALVLNEHTANAHADILTDATGEAVLTIDDADGTVYLMAECQGIVTATEVTITTT
jgi:predicted RecA/RadA family phage recombinase